MKIQKILVIGAGQMGTGIAQTCAKFGYGITLYDVNQGALDRGLAIIQKSYARDIEKERLTENEVQSALSKIVFSNILSSSNCNVDLVIEAVIENIEIKSSIFNTLEEYCPSHTIFASNTSSISITKIAALTARPQSFIGIHFFNPVSVMNLVEVISGKLTSQTTIDVALEFCSMLEKTAVQSLDYPGFIGNRLVIPMINEAIYLLMEGVATAEDIDNVSKLGFNHPMGPLALADMIGNDTVLHIMEVLYKGFCDPKYRPCPLLRQMVDAKLLGRKTGKGFYEYDQ